MRNQPHARDVQRSTMMVMLRLVAARWQWNCIIAGLGAVILASSCAQQKVTTLSPVTGPCAGQPPGCGSSQGSATALAAGHWSRLPSGPLSTRAGQASVWTGHQLLVWGGVSSYQPGAGGLSDGAAYNPSTQTWNRMPRSPLSPRLGSTAVWMGKEAMLWGGEEIVGPGEHAFADGAAYNPATATWRTLPRSPLEARTGATAIWTGSQAIIFGGMTANGMSLYDGATYNPRTNLWHSLPVMPLSHPASAVGATVAWTGTGLLVWVTYEFTTRLTGNSSMTSTGKQAFSWKPGSSTWSQIPSPPDNVFTFGANAIWTGQRVLLLGSTGCLPGMGCPAEATGRGFAFDPALAVWREIPSRSVLVRSVPESWTGHAVVALNQGAEIGAGTRAILSPGDGAVYDPASGGWLNLPRGPVRTLDDASVAWTGRQLLVWDGGDT